MLLSYSDPKVQEAEKRAEAIAEEIRGKARDVGVASIWVEGSAEIVRTSYLASRGSRYYTGYASIQVVVLRGGKPCRRTWTDAKKPIPVDEIVRLLVELDAHNKAEEDRRENELGKLRNNREIERKLREKHPDVCHHLCAGMNGLTIEIGGISEALADAVLTLIEEHEKEQVR